MDLWLFVKQISDFIKFTKLNRSKNLSNLLYSNILFVMSVSKPSIIKILSYFTITLLEDTACFSKPLRDSAGLYTVKCTQILLPKLSS